jgi:hypothetical protein
MNSQEYHSLQEAYMNVYQEVDEETLELDEVRGGGKIDAVSDIPSIGERGSRSAKDAGMLMSPLERARARANALKKRGNTKQANQIKSRFVNPTDSAVNRSLLAATNARSAEKRRLQALNNSYDLFDVILAHLLAEGYADTNENALVIMANMSEEWRESVISEMPFQVTGPDPRSSDPNSPHVSIGKPYQSKKRAKTQADKLDAEIGGYRHKVKYVA